MDYKYHEGYCTKVQATLNILVHYSEIPVLGILNKVYKKTGFSCECRTDCEICDSCPVFKEAPLEG